MAIIGQSNLNIEEKYSRISLMATARKNHQSINLLVNMKEAKRWMEKWYGMKMEQKFNMKVLLMKEASLMEKGQLNTQEELMKELLVMEKNMGREFSNFKMA